MSVVGVLALQGDFEAHLKALGRAGAEAIPVRTRDELAKVDGLIIPGGESTTMLKLLQEENLCGSLREYGRVRSVFGTCAGVILMAADVTNPIQESLGLMNLKVERNAYGRQIDSSIVRVTPLRGSLNEGGDLEAVFIRAPIIREVRGDAQVLARHNGDPVLVEQGKHLAATFHPELTQDSRVHQLFLEKVNREEG